ncbi:MAG: NAD(P)H-hydrate dehydratase [Mariprofundus sp.]|nr:NAD(P)H-hydrate dehydratase [Mariprofundus sp.]
MNETRILTAAQMRWADQATTRTGASTATLMDRAGVAIAAAVIECMPDYGRIVIIAGPGNNGGDGFAAAYYLRDRRLPVTVVSLIPLADLSDDVKIYADRAHEAGAKTREACADGCFAELERWLVRASMIVDCMFGTGVSRPLEGRMRDVVERINVSDRAVLSVDIASGICADTGCVLGVAVQADFTLPIATTKWGHWLNEGRDYTGKLLAAADIGITDATIQQGWAESCECADEDNCFCVKSTSVIHDDFLDKAWPVRARLSHKGSYGHVWIFGGSMGLTGAPQLAGLGAYAAGAGLASIVCPDAVWPVIAAANLEVMAHPQSDADWQSADALVIGPGWGRAQGELLSTLFDTDKPIVVDADALNIVAARGSLRQKLIEREYLTVISPHPGEAARLLDITVEEVQRDRKKSVIALTTRYACWVVLKGSETLIASPQKDIYLNPFGSAQLAVAGSGDVLAGMIGAQLAKRNEAVSPAIAIAAAVALHGKAGERGGWYLAGELAKVISDMRQSIEQGGMRH